MAQTYTRQSSFSDGDTITAALFNDEYNQLVNAFSYSSSDASATGHRHDGTAAQGGNIHTIGDLDFLNKIVVDSTNNRWGVYVEVSGSAVEQIRIQDGAIVPVTDNDIDLGTSSLEFKDLFLDGTATVDTLSVDANATVAGTLGVTGAATLSSTLALTGAATLSSTLAVTGTTTLTGNVTTTNDLSVGGNLTVTGTTTFNGGTITMGDAATDNVVFGADVDSHIIPDDDNTYDLGSSSQEWRDLYVDGTAYLDAINFNGTAITATAAELNILDGVTSTATELNLLDGVTATTAELNYLDVTTLGTVEASKAVTADANADVKFGDSDKLVFGAGSDLQIYHDGSNSYIDDAGTGGLSIRSNLLQIGKYTGELSAQFVADGESNLYYDNSKKLATTSTGIDVTGTITADSAIFGTTSDSSTIVYLTSSTTGESELRLGDTDTDAGSIAYTNSNDTLTFRAAAAARMTLNSTGLDVTGSVTANGGVIVDNITIDGTEIDLSSGDLTIDVAGDIILDADGGDWRFKDAGTSILEISNVSSSAALYSAVSDADMLFKGNDGGSAITALTLDMSAAGEATFNDDINLGDSKRLRMGAGGDFEVFHDGSNNYIKGASSDQDLIFQGVDGGSAITALTLDMSEAGAATFNSTVQATALTLGDNSTSEIPIAFASSSTDFAVGANGNNFILAQSTGDLDSNALFTVTNTGNVGIGTSSPDSTLHVHAASAGSVTALSGTNLTVEGNANNYLSLLSPDANLSALVYGSPSSTNNASINSSYNSGSPYLNFNTGGSEAMRIDSSGNLGVGTTSTTSIRLQAVTPTANHVAAQIENSNTADSFGLVVKGGNDANDYTADFRKRDNTNIMRIRGDGNVGIGSTTPTFATGSGLEIQRTTATATLRLEYTGSNGYEISAEQTQVTYNSVSSLPHVFEIGSTEKMRLDSSGNLGIGTSSPAYKLSLVDTTQVGTTIQLFRTGSAAGSMFINSGLAFGADGGNGDTQRMVISSSTGNVGIGTTSPGRLLEVNTNGEAFIRIRSSDSGNAGLEFGDQSDSVQGAIFMNASDNSLRFNGFDNSEVMRIDSSGNVGIGTTSPSQKLSVVGNIASTGVATPEIELVPTGSVGNADIRFDGTTLDIRSNSASASLLLSTASTERVRIDSSGEITFKANAGSVSHVFAYNEDGGEIKLADETGATGTLIDQSLNSTRVLELINGSNLALGLGSSNTTGNILFYKAGFSEAARIDSSGNLFIGRTSSGNTGLGHSIRGGDSAIFSRDATGETVQIGRNADAGDLVRFYANGTQIGSIGTVSGLLGIGSGDSILAFDATGNAMYPMSSQTGGASDGLLDLGSSLRRFKDFYLAGDITQAIASGAGGDTFISAITGVSNGYQITIDASNNQTYKWHNASTQTMTLNSAGELLVGTTSVDDSNDAQIGNHFAYPKTGMEFKSNSALAHFAATFRNTNGLVGSISTTGSATAFNTSSDQRLKENIVDAPSASDDIDAIQVRSFDWKGDGSHQKYGMVAQELVTVAPSAVSQPEDPEEMMGVDYSKLVPMMLKEIQQLRARVAQLEGDN